MEKQKITGSEALLKSLIAEGVDTIFGYPGGQAIPIYDSLYDYRDKLKHVTLSSLALGITAYKFSQLLQQQLR